MFIQSYILPLKRCSSWRSKGDFSRGPEAAGDFLVNAIQRLSGLKTGAPSTPGIWNASPLGRSMRRNQVSPSVAVPLRVERNARSFPSGLHFGAEALNIGLVRRVAALDPSAGLSHNPVWRWFSDSIIEERTKPTQRPSGEIAAEAARSTRQKPSH